MKYRKKPVVVEANQWRGIRTDGPTPVPPGVFRDVDNGQCYVVTIHGQKTYIQPGDWIIAEPDGIHYYPCKPDIFFASYDPM